MMPSSTKQRRQPSTPAFDPEVELAEATADATSHPAATATPQAEGSPQAEAPSWRAPLPSELLGKWQRGMAGLAIVVLSGAVANVATPLIATAVTL